MLPVPSPFQGSVELFCHFVAEVLVNSEVKAILHIDFY